MDHFCGVCHTRYAVCGLCDRCRVRQSMRSMAEADRRRAERLAAGGGQAPGPEGVIITIQPVTEVQSVK